MEKNTMIAIYKDTSEKPLSTKWYDVDLGPYSTYSLNLWLAESIKGKYFLLI